MKKVLFAAFAGMCVVSSIMATSANTGKLSSTRQINQVLRDTVPPTDTAKKAEVFLMSDTVPGKKDTTRKPGDTSRIMDLSVR
jgi:hypothetical protein